MGTTIQYFDKQHRRLVCIGSRADEDYWNAHWRIIDAKMLYKLRVPTFHFVVNTTRKYLPAASVILEGGAGLAQNSWYLYLAGYKAIALDFASKTVNYVKQHRPELNPILGDVRNLPLGDSSIDGYWSLGVIEHFLSGYNEIISEMRRVLCTRGFVFLTFPAMSFLRKTKAKRGLYPPFEESQINSNHFYQFILDADRVSDDFKYWGFKLVEERELDGVKGLKDEISLLETTLQHIYDGKSFFSKGMRTMLNVMLSRWTGHLKFFVFQKY